MDDHKKLESEVKKMYEQMIIKLNFTNGHLEFIKIYKKKTDFSEKDWLP